MSDIAYRLFFNNKPATREQLDRVEEITVEQEVDMAWEARIEIPICVDEKGKWTGEDEDFMKPFSRIRVEIKIGKAPFVPLIDGPIVKSDSPKSSEPGQSAITLIVQDDSVFLNREDNVSRFEGRLDHEIAKQIFDDFEQIAATDIDDTSPPGSAPPPVIQRGTSMQILRSLAKRQGMHAYVFPGDRPGQSVGNFKFFPKPSDLPQQTDELPPLILLGSDRNIKSFNVKKNAQKPSVVRASTLRITDKGVVSSTASFRDRELLGQKATLEEGEEPAVQILPPRQGESVDLDQAVSAKVDESSYAFEATGSVLEGCYLGVLRPYRLVTVKAGETPLSGNYLITKVTHGLTRSIYSQSFSLKTDAQSKIERSNGSLTNLAGGIF
ncbi:MAG: hypothetical protein ACE5JP_00085 [Candidatus Bipolaricaulia bacterium]